MLKHSFSDFSYAVNTTSSKKGYKEILVCYIYNGIEVLRKVYIRENAGTSYIFEAKKIIDQEMRNGSLASYSHKFIRRNKKRIVKAKKPADANSLVGKNTETAPVVQIEAAAPSSGAPAPKEKKNLKGHLPLIITASVAILAIVGMAIGMVFLAKNGGKEPEPEAGYDVVFHIPSAITLESGEKTSKAGENYECKFSIDKNYYYQYGLDPEHKEKGVEIYMGNRQLSDTQVSDEYDFDVATGYLKIKVPTENAIHITITAIPKADVPVSDYEYISATGDEDYSKVIITDLKRGTLEPEEVLNVEIKNTFEDEKGKHEVVGIGALPKPDPENKNDGEEYGKGILNGYSNLQNLTIPFIGLDKEANPSVDGRHLLGALFGEKTFKGAETLTYQDYYHDGKLDAIKAAIPSSLRKVTVTNGTSIPAGAFSNCAYIQEIDIQKVSGEADDLTIKEYACHGCRALSKFTCPNYITEIKEHAFDSCQTLASFDFSNIQTVGERAFKDCLNFSDVYLPGGVETINERAFENFEGLIKCFADEKPNGWDENWAGEYSAVAYGIKNREINPIINENYSYIIVGEGEKKSVYIIQYVGKKDANEIKIPEKLSDRDLSEYPVSQIGTKAFMGVEVTSIDMSNCSGLVSIGSYSFANCPNLTTIKFDPNCPLTTIGIEAFADCVNLTISDTTVFPSALTTIGNGAFKNDTALTKLILTNVTSVGDSAFESCSELTSVTLKSGASANVTLGDSAFKNCVKLSSVGYNITDGIIPNYCFYNTALNSISVPAGVTKIGDYAYAQCTKADSINVDSERLISVGNSAFQRCRNAKGEVLLPTTTKEIGVSAFQDCYRLTGIYCMGTLTEISDSVCYGDSNLNYFVYGSGSKIKKIGAYAFAQDQLLTYVGVYTTGKEEKRQSNNEMSPELAAIGDRAFINCIGLGQYDTQYGQITTPIHIKCPATKHSFDMGEQVFYGWYDGYGGDYNILKIDAGWFNYNNTKINWDKPWTITSVGGSYYTYTETGSIGDLYIQKAS